MLLVVWVALGLAVGCLLPDTCALLDVLDVPQGVVRSMPQSEQRKQAEKKKTGHGCHMCLSTHGEVGKQ